MSYFDEAFEYLMINEGGGQYVDRPGDSGGPTKWGVSLRFLRKLKSNQALDSDSIKALTKDDAKAIAHSEFWMPLRLDFATDKRVAMALLDIGYLTGVPHTASYAQMAQKTLSPSLVLDGVLGPKFWECANRGPTSLFLTAFINLNVNYFESLADTKPQVKPFLQGWLNRIYKIKSL